MTTPNEKKKTSILRVVLIVFATLSVIVLAMSIPFMSAQKEMALKLKLSELPSTLAGLKVNLEYYKQESGNYLAIEAYPPDPSPEGQLWDREGSGAFRTLGFEPMTGTVYGSYWVELSDDGTSFTAFATSDIDGDGVRATFAATNEKDPERLTPEDVF